MPSFSCLHVMYSLHFTLEKLQVKFDVVDLEGNSIYFIILNIFQNENMLVMVFIVFTCLSTDEGPQDTR